MRPPLLLLSLALLLPFQASGIPLDQQIAELLAITLQNHPQLQATEHEIAAKRAEKQTIRTWGESSAQVSWGKDPSDLELTLAQELQMPGLVREERHAQEQRIVMSQLERDRILFTLRQELVDASVSLYVLERSLEFTEINIDVVREMARTAETKYAAGQAPQGDTMKAHFELTMLELERQQLLQELEGAKSRLRNLVRKPAWSPPSWRGEELNPPLLSEQEIEDWLGAGLAKLLDRSFTRRLQAVRVAEAEALQRVAEARLWPRWDIGITQDLHTEGLRRPPMLMLGMKLPLWPEARRASVLAQEHLRTSTEQQLEASAWSTQTFVETQLRRLKGDRIALKIYKTSLLPQALSSFQASRAAYNASRSSLIDLLDSERSLYRVKTGQLRALLSYVKNLLLLEVELQTVLSPLAPLPQEVLDDH